MSRITFVIVSAGWLACWSAARAWCCQEAGRPPAGLEQPDSAALAELAMEMHREVESLRGWKFKTPVGVDSCSETELREFMRRGRTEASGGAPAYGDQAARMVGLIPPDADPGSAFTEAMMGYVPAIYDHESKTVRIVRRPGADYGSLLTRTMLAHELTHALDHQYFESTYAERSTRDAEFVAGAIFEGSAITVQSRYEATVRASAKFAPGEWQQTMAQQMKMGKIMLETPAYALTPFVARFPCGGYFLQRGAAYLESQAKESAVAPTGRLRCVGDAMMQAARNLPASSEQILHPEKYWDQDHRDEPVLLTDEDAERLIGTGGLRVVHKDTFGELLCALLAWPQDKRINPLTVPSPGSWTNDAAMGWGGDRFFLLVADEAGGTSEATRREPVGLWFTMWDSPQDRDEFVAAYNAARALGSRVSVMLGDRTAVFFYAFDEELRDALSARLKREPPRLSKGGAR